MTFAEILPFLDKGFAVRRTEYDKTLIIFKQIPAIIQGAPNVTEHNTQPTQQDNSYYVWTMPETKGIEKKNKWLLEDKRRKK